MDWDKSILEIVPNYDFILLDANLFNALTDGDEDDLCSQLYYLKYPTQLFGFRDILTEFNEGLKWKYKGFVESDNVFTIEKVKDEIVNLEEIFSNVYSWHNSILDNLNSEKTFKVSRRRYNGKPFQYIRRQNKLIEKNLERIRINNVDVENLQEEMNLLRKITNNIYYIIKDLKMYSNESKKFSFEIKDASDTDYALVGSALDYTSRNEGSKVAVVSNDKHIVSIRNENDFENDFDIITRENYGLILQN